MMALVPAGGGHGSAARAVSEALLELDPTVEISVVNVSASPHRLSPVNAIPRLYAAMTLRVPWFWRAVFHATNGRRRYALADAAMQPFVRPRVKALLRAERPDVVLSLNPALGPIVREALRDLRSPAPLGIVVSDLITLHQAWFCPGAAWHAVPSEPARKACLRAGLPPEAVHVTGQPVGQSFCQEPGDRAALRHKLGLDPEGPVALVVGGGEGIGQVEATVRALVGSGLPCQLVVIAGRNERLRRRLAAATAGPGCHVLGYVTNMAEWMQAADLLVSKAGPNTVMEAVHCRLPMVLTGAIPGQEEANLEFVARNRLGLLATRPEEIVAAVDALLSQPAKAAAMRQAAEGWRRPGAAREVARLVLESHPT